MRRAWLMVRKDLRRTVRRPLGMSIMLLFPLLFAGMIAVTFGAGSEPTMPRVKLLVEDLDESLVSGVLMNALRSEQMAESFEVEEAGDEGGRARMERGDASALLVIPEKFGDDLLHGHPTRLELVRNPAEQILPEVAEQLALSLVEVLDAGSRALRGPLEDLARMIESGDGAPPDAAVSAMAVAVNRVMTSAGPYVMPPAITLEAVTLDEPEGRGSGGGGVPSVFLIVLPGIAVFALFMLGDQAMRDLLEESQTGTLRRQLSGPLGAGAVVAGKALFTAVVSVLSLAILTAVGAVVSPRAVDLPGFVLLGAALVLMVTGTAALVYGLARTERQGATLASMIYLFLGFIGGGFIQPGNLPPFLRAIAPYTPFYWASEGFRNLVNRGAGLADVLGYVALLAFFGAAMLVLGGRLLQRKVLAGWAG